MKVLNRSIGVGLVACSMYASSAMAYQFEAGGTYFDFDELNDSALAINGIFHFSPVSTSGLPLAEAGFLGRSSNATAFYSTFDDNDIDILGVGGEFFIQDLYASADFIQTDAGATDFDAISVEAGFLPMDGLRFTVGYLDEDETNTSAISLNAKMVKQLGGGNAINLEASVAQADDLADTVGYDLNGDFYVTKALSFGLGYSDTDAPNSNEIIDFRARMFVIPNLSFQIQYTTQDSGPGADGDLIALGVAGRF